MNGPFQKMIGICKILIVFITLTFFFYGLIVWIGDQVYQNYRYDNPKGRAKKVIQPVNQPASITDFNDIKDRLLFYYWFGE